MPKIHGSDADIVINSTSLGLQKDDPLPIPLDDLRPDTIIADIIMVPSETNWLAAAKAAGLRSALWTTYAGLSDATDWQIYPCTMIESRFHD